MYDLRVDLGDGRFGAVEVTAAERQDLAATQAAISKQPLLTCSQLRSGWMVVLNEGAVVNEARSRLPGILMEFEECDISDLTVFRCEEGEEWAVERLKWAHVQTVQVVDFLNPGTIGITGPMRVDWLSLDPDDVVTFAERFIGRRPSDVAKLSESGADERHLFIWSGVFSEGMREIRALGLDVGAVPHRDPQLPKAVTHLWIAPSEGARPSRIVHWSPADGWAQAGVVNNNGGAP